MLNPAFHEEMQRKAPRYPLACRAGRGPALAAALGRSPGERSPQGGLARLAASHRIQLPPMPPASRSPSEDGRLPRMQRGTRGPASDLKAGAQPDAHREHVWHRSTGPASRRAPANAKGMLLLG